MTERGEVTRIGVSLPLGDVQTGSTDEAPMVTEVAVQLGPDSEFWLEVVDAQVLPEDQAEVGQLLLDGTLREGASARILRFGLGDDDDIADDDQWVLLEVEDTEVRSASDEGGTFTVPPGVADED